MGALSALCRKRHSPLYAEKYREEEPQVSLLFLIPPTPLIPIPTPLIPLISLIPLILLIAIGCIQNVSKVYLGCISPLYIEDIPSYRWGTHSLLCTEKEYVILSVEQKKTLPYVERRSMSSSLSGRDTHSPLQREGVSLLPL